jgi:uncharacterized protein (TIGR00369 family)
MMEVLTNPDEIRSHIRDIYKPNHYMMDFMKYDIERIDCGDVVVSLHTDPALHTNHRGIIHGGAMASLVDSVTGVTSASQGAVVVTVSLQISYIHNTTPGETMRCHGHIIHHGRTTIVITGDVKDDDGTLMGTFTANMMVVKRFPEIPKKW